jgi:Fe-S-cluster containining protein
MRSELFQTLAKIYTDMDKAWDLVASQYGFLCNGCEDNCCKSLFFHHTFIEKAYLLHGFQQLPEDITKTVLALAKTYYTKTFPDGTQETSQKLICPLNREGQCLVYPYRPMICRLHGIPHELHKPGAFPLKGAGCNTGQFDNTPYIPFDRTPFYREMASVEMNFRQENKETGRIKETVAQMLLF